MVQTASGGKLSRAQAINTWDKTILPLGKRLGLLTGYVKPQEDTSKRTAAGNIALQKKMVQHGFRTTCQDQNAGYGRVEGRAIGESDDAVLAGEP